MKAEAWELDIYAGEYKKVALQLLCKIDDVDFHKPLEDERPELQDEFLACRTHLPSWRKQSHCYGIGGNPPKWYKDGVVQ